MELVKSKLEKLKNPSPESEIKKRKFSPERARKARESKEVISEKRKHRKKLIDEAMKSSSPGAAASTAPRLVPADEYHPDFIPDKFVPPEISKKWDPKPEKIEQKWWDLTPSFTVISEESWRDVYKGAEKDPVTGYEFLHINRIF